MWTKMRGASGQRGDVYSGETKQITRFTSNLQDLAKPE